MRDDISQITSPDAHLISHPRVSHANDAIPG
jgi:hypothetical protein